MNAVEQAEQVICRYQERREPSLLALWLCGPLMVTAWACIAACEWLLRQHE